MLPVTIRIREDGAAAGRARLRKRRVLILGLDGVLQGGEEEVWAFGETQGLRRPGASLPHQGGNHRGMLLFCPILA